MSLWVAFLLLALAGVALLSDSGVMIWGLDAEHFAAVSAGAGLVLLIASSLGDRVEALPFAALVATGAGAAFAVVDLARGGGGVTTGGGVALIVVFALVPTAFGFFAFLRGISRIGAPRASIIGAVEPAVAVAIGVLVLGERFRSLQVVGGVLVIGAIVLLEMRRDRSGTRAPRTA